MNNDQNQVPHPKCNGAMCVECKALRYPVFSAAEAETADIFCNAQIDTSIGCILEQLGH